MHAAVELNEASRPTFVTWLPPFHDMGLVGTYLHALYANARLVILNPTTFIARPERWLQAISEYGAAYSGGPNFAYDLCVSRIDEASVDALDLSTWARAFNGAEPVRADTLDAFANKFERAKFQATALYPCYGLAEATLMVTGSTPGQVLRRSA